MRTNRLLLLFTISIFLTASCQKEIETDIENKTNNQEIAVEKANTYVITTDTETLSDELKAEIEKYGKISSSLPEIGVVYIELNKTQGKKQILDIEGIESITPNYLVKFSAPAYVSDKILKINAESGGDGETEIPQHEWLQWSLDAIDAREAWAAEPSMGEGCKVFVLDTGIDAEHPDIAPNLNTSLCKSFINRESWNVREGNYFNHGTHVAGIIAAAGNDNGYGIIGVAPKAEIVAVKVLSEYNGGGSFESINNGIIYAANNGADVINMSLGGRFPDTDQYKALIKTMQRAIKYANKKGVVVIASAGNNGINADLDEGYITLPAQLKGVITVSATSPIGWMEDNNTNLDIPTSYTNYGKSIVDLAAPGGGRSYDSVLSSIPGGWTWASGTSMASPQVAGVAALIIAKNNGNISVSKVKNILYKNADEIDADKIYYGKGRVNAVKSVLNKKRNRRRNTNPRFAINN